MADLPPDLPAGLSTDADWETWGRNDPYFAVITHERFRRAVMDDAAREEFFRSGRTDVKFAMDVIHMFVDPAFKPRSVLDFGCGVGRLVAAFAAMAPDVMGVDISPSMLREARNNCDALGFPAVALEVADDELSRVQREFDMVYSSIVFQHIPVERVRVIFASLIRRLAPGGVGALHFLYSKSTYADTHGLPPPAPAPPMPAEPTVVAAPDIVSESRPLNPVMQMNPFPMNTALFIMQKAGITRFHVEFTDHGGEMGAFVFFKKPRAT